MPARKPGPVRPSSTTAGRALDFFIDRNAISPRRKLILAVKRAWSGGPRTRNDEALVHVMELSLMSTRAALAIESVLKAYPAAARSGLSRRGDIFIELETPRHQLASDSLHFDRKTGLSVLVDIFGAQARDVRSKLADARTDRLFRTDRRRLLALVAERDARVREVLPSRTDATGLRTRKRAA
jgi:hypothetical protein